MFDVRCSKPSAMSSITEDYIYTVYHVEVREHGVFFLIFNDKDTWEMVSSRHFIV